MIEFENVSFSYTGQEHGGLHDINLKISDGECVLFCGRSGCGKTTITRLVNGLIPQFYQGELQGRVLVDGQEISSRPMYQIAAKVGSVFQNPRTQFFNVDTDSEIAFGIENEARPPQELIERVEQTADDLRIQKLRNRNIFELSGGEKQKIAFASVYAMNPQIYLLDEPSSNLDMTSIQELREHLRLIKKQGKTVLIAEHRLYYLMELADRIVYLEKGEIKGIYVGSMYLTEIRPLQELGTNFANVLNAITKTKEILDIPIYEGGTDFPQKHDIELRNVRFSYDGKTDVLHGVNLKIHDGERMALVGRSGAGKSTVIELISRFYDVQEGEVLIGGKNVKELDYDTILKNIAIVFQKTFLTRDSVLENIRMGSNATLEEVRAAAKEAQIDDFIMSLPDGYDTKVGSFGSRFSGGEKQRIAIARAILKNAPILILDEATSASDPENQMEIDKAIQNLCKGKTVIVVAHRLSALKMCNRVAVVENHTITSVGIHEEVRKNNAYYRKAWDDYETARNITYQLEGGEQHE